MKKIIETERLYLREFTAADSKDLYMLDNDKDVMRYISTLYHKEITMSECERSIKRSMDYYRTHEGFGIWATILKESDDFIGWTTLKNLDNSDIIELGYRYHKKFWGNGYGTEISKALVQYGFDTLKLSSIAAVALPQNKASIRIMQKIGMEYIGIKHFYNADVAYYEITNDGGESL